VPLLTFEFQDRDVHEWHATSDGVEKRWNRDYEPALFVDGPRDALDTLQQALQRDPKVTSTR
jgi:DNA polymerase I